MWPFGKKETPPAPNIAFQKVLEVGMLSIEAACITGGWLVYTYAYEDVNVCFVTDPDHTPLMFEIVGQRRELGMITRADMRSRTPDGWLYILLDNRKVGMCLIHDPEHLWDGSSQAWE